MAYLRTMSPWAYAYCYVLPGEYFEPPLSAQFEPIARITHCADQEINCDDLFLEVPTIPDCYLA